MRAIVATALLLATTAAAQADTNHEAVEAAVARLLPGQPPAEIVPSAVPGLSEVAVGTQVFYVSNDGRFLLGGPLIEVAGRENLTERRVAVARKQILDVAAETRLYRYTSENPRYRVAVVTDIDCPYCRRLHAELDEYRELGIDLEYIMLPRAGKGSASYNKTVAAACADDPEAAITAAMNGSEAQPATCDHPIDEHMELARQLGATSTPTLYFDDGRMLLGARSPEAVLQAIESAQ